MTGRTRPSLSGRGLRAEVTARNLADGHVAQELTYGKLPSILYCEDGRGGHGNFLQASYRRILADPAWASRLNKTYTANSLVPRSYDRRRGELEYAGSSDALLMNVFCYPGVLRRPSLCSLLGISRGLRPSFGVRASLPMRKGEIDRTELDMVLGDLLVEAKLTEAGFGRASRQRVLRYEQVEEAFDVEELPATPSGIAGYQLVRGILAAAQQEREYLVLLDARRADLQEICFRVLRAVRSAEVRNRLRLLTWQDLSISLPPTLQRFLGEKYGILPP